MKCLVYICVPLLYVSSLFLIFGLVSWKTEKEKSSSRSRSRRRRRIQTQADTVIAFWRHFTQANLEPVHPLNATLMYSPHTHTNIHPQLCVLINLSIYIWLYSALCRPNLTLLPFAAVCDICKIYFSTVSSSFAFAFVFFLVFFLFLVRPSLTPLGH